MADVQLQASKILTPAEEKELDKTIGDLKDIRDNKELAQGINFEVKDKASLDKKISNLEKIRQENSLPRLDKSDIEKVQREFDLLQSDLRRGMPTWSEYEGMRPHHGARFAALVKQIVKWEEDPIRRQKIARWKTLRRLLNPDDADAGNTMYLFPQSDSDR